MASEFWNENLTLASWEKLQEISKKYKFVLIGGWAVYLWAGMQKSKDIDLVVDYNELLKLRSEFKLEKNERLFKYEAKLEKFDIDIYLPGYSKISVHCKEILLHSVRLQGIPVAEAEILLLLKQGAYSARGESVKGRKDRIDIINMLAKSGLSLEKYAKYAKEFGHADYPTSLKAAVSSFPKEDLPYTGMNEYEFSRRKQKFLDGLKSLI